MAKPTVDINNFIWFGYLVAPILFYGIPYFVALNSGGVLHLHFFETFSIPASTFYQAVLIHAFLGFCLKGLFIHKRITLTYNSTNSIIYQFFITCLFIATLFIPVSYLTVFIFPVFIYFVASYRPNFLGFICLYCVAIICLLFYYDRYPIVLVSLIVIMPHLHNSSFIKVIMLSLFGICILVFILQPLRAGLSPFGFASIFYFYKHMHPIYIGAHTFLVHEFSYAQLLVEALPLFKSISGSASAIQIIDQTYLPSNSPSLGSNSTMYFNLLGLILIVSLVCLYKFFFSIANSLFLNNALVMYLYIHAPYFVRRSIGTFLIDILVLLVVGAIMTMFIYRMKRNYD